MRPSLNVTLYGVALIVLLSGCAQLPAVFEYRPTDDAQATMVWPEAPQQPRYRYVGQLTGEENFPRPGADTVNAGTRLLRWLVGLVGHSPDPVILQRPQAVVSDGEGRIYVSDVSRQAVYLFDTVEAELSVWEYAAPELRFEAPTGMAISAADGLLVADASLGMVVELARDGSAVATIGREALQHPVGLARDPGVGRLYVADRGSNSIKVFNDGGELVLEFGQHGEAQGLFNGPTYLFWWADRLYVTDTLNSRVQVFSATGEYQFSFGRRGLYVGDLPRPKGVAVDPNGNIYVVESFYDYLLIFDQTGEFLLPIGGSGHGIGQFYLPSGVWVDGNYVYVADTFNGRVMIFEYLGDRNASEVVGDGSSDIINAARE